MTRNGMFVATAAVLSVAAFAGQNVQKAVTVKGGESGMVGIKLYDTGARVISVYGNPTEIQPVSFGGGSIGPAAGGGPGGPGGGPPRAGVGGPGGGNAPATGVADNSPFGFGDDMLMFQRGRGGGPDGDDEGGRGGPGGGFGPPQGAVPPGAGGGGGRPGMGAGGGGNTSKIIYTRWIYKRGTSKYGFILDKFNRVVQIEAIGMSDGRVKTSKGVRFGSTFGDIIKKYQTPDGYEINGDNIVVRYLVRNKVAFRLSRLGANRPHTVTGIVVAGGKT